MSGRRSHRHSSLEKDIILGERMYVMLTHSTFSWKFLSRLLKNVFLTFSGDLLDTGFTEKLMSNRAI